MKKDIKKILVGLFAGIVSGLFAAGGGMIVVPALIHLFNIEDRKARATSVFSILPMVITSGIFYYGNNYIDWKLGATCAIGGIIGGYIGAKLLKKLPTKILKIAQVNWRTKQKYSRFTDKESKPIVTKGEREEGAWD